MCRTRADNGSICHFGSNRGPGHNHHVDMGNLDIFERSVQSPFSSGRHYENFFDELDSGVCMQNIRYVPKTIGDADSGCFNWSYAI